jgi:hypothetical protein
MGVAPERIEHLRLAGDFLGNVAEERIEVLGERPSGLRQAFVLPPGFERARLG